MKDSQNSRPSHSSTNNSMQKDSRQPSSLNNSGQSTSHKQTSGLDKSQQPRFGGQPDPHKKK